MKNVSTASMNFSAFSGGGSWYRPSRVLKATVPIPTDRIIMK